MAVRLLDTNIVSYLLKNHSLATVYQPHLTGFTLAVSFQTVAELLEGSALAKWGAPKQAKLHAMIHSLIILETTPAVCERWADVRVARSPRPIGVADAWIAATALATGVELVTHNPADFKGIPGLVVITECP